jgi:cytochrome P450
MCRASTAPITKSQAVIYEGLRINIPFSGLVMKQVPPGGDTINGQFVPGGTRIATDFLGIQRSKATFGEDADLFRPERWLDLPVEQAAQWRQHVELVFGAGRWGCSGKSLAFMELNKVYIEVRVHHDCPLALIAAAGKADLWMSRISFSGISTSNS